MNSLPMEILITILDYIPLNQRKELRRVNRKFKEAIEVGLRNMTHLYIDYINNNIKFRTESKYIEYLINRDEKVPYGLWMFISKYCPNLIYIDSKVRTKMIKLSSPKHGYFSQFVSNVEYIQIKGFHHCYDDSMVQNIISRRSNNFHMSTPCNKFKPECVLYNNNLPIGLKSLKIEGNSHEFPRMNNKITESLTELKLHELPNLFKLSGKFKSLERLTLNFHKLDAEYAVEYITRSIKSTMMKFEEASFTLKSIEIHLNVYKTCQSKIEKFISSLENLVIAVICLNGSNINLNLRSKKLKKMRLLRVENVTVYSTEITDLSLSSLEEKFFLHMSFQNVLTLNIRRTFLGLKASGVIKRSLHLRYLYIHQCELKDHLKEDFTSIFTFLPDLIYFEFNCKSDGIVMDIQKNKCLKTVISNTPIIFKVNNRFKEITYLKLELKKQEAILTFLDGHECEIFISYSLEHNYREKRHLDFVFIEEMTHLTSISFNKCKFDVYSTIFLKDLIEKIDEKSPEIQHVKFSSSYESMFKKENFEKYQQIATYSSFNLLIELIDNGQFKEIVLKWIKKLNELKKFIAPLGSEDLSIISQHFKENEQIEIRLPNADE